MVELEYDLEAGPPLKVELRNPYWAALLAWLWPGAGHFYQGRFTKGFLFMICVLSLFFVGLALGHGRVVYASFAKNDWRWQYLLQAGVGAPAAPALIQAWRTSEGGDPFFVLCERYPPGYGLSIRNPAVLDFHRIPAGQTLERGVRSLKDGFMAPPAGKIFLEENDVLGMWHAELKHWFEIGTVYTVIAGLLNLLAVYDALCGPMLITPAERRAAAERRQARKRRKSE